MKHQFECDHDRQKKKKSFSESLSMSFNNLLAKYLLLLHPQRPESKSVRECICAGEMLCSYLYYHIISGFDFKHLISKH